MLRVDYLPLDQAPSRQAAWKWLTAALRFDPRRLSPDHLDDMRRSPPAVLWVDAAPTTTVGGALAGVLADPPCPLLLTHGAVRSLELVGILAVAPRIVIDTTWPDARESAGPDAYAGSTAALGHAPFLEHPLFRGLEGGAVTWRPRSGDPFEAVLHDPHGLPDTTRIIAVERTDEDILPDRVTIWECALPTGSRGEHRAALCIGAHLPFAAQDATDRPVLALMIANALALVAGEAPAGPTRYWSVRPTATRRREVTAADAHQAAGTRQAQVEPLSFSDTPLRRAVAADAAPFTIAGRRASAVVSSTEGLVELWIHPLCAARDLRAAGAVCRATTSTPAGIERVLDLGGRTVLERIFLPHDAAGAVVEWQAEDAGPPIPLAVGWTTDLRLSPPYPANALGSLTWAAEARLLTVRTDEPGFGAAWHLEARDAVWSITDASDPASSRLQCRFRTELRPGECARLRIAGEGRGPAWPATLASLAEPASLLRARNGALRRLARERLHLVTPDARIAVALEWAKAGLDASTVDAPGVGKAPATGLHHATRASGDEPTRFGCTFGRESIRPALASLACGAFEPARAALLFLAGRQHPAGQILEACTTSGFDRYRGTAGTALYLLLAARYLGWTGDTAFLQSQWSTVRRALAFLLPRFAPSPTDDADAPADARAGFHPDPDASSATVLREIAAAAETIGDRQLALTLHSRIGSLRRTPVADTASPGPFLVDGPGGIACADIAAESGASAVVLSLVFRLLGASPDAPRHRIRLAPRIPADWHHLEVRALRVGDATLDLAYHRDQDQHTFRIVQSRGAVPATLIFEPCIPGRRLACATVDDRAADLDAHPSGERLRVPVQLVLDHARTVHLTVPA